MRTTANRPYTSNYPELQNWLDAIDARCVWQVPLGTDSTDPVMYLEQWSALGSLMIVLVRADRAGWEIYTPHPSSKVDVTLADAETRLRAR